MNNLFHFSKIASFCILLALLFTACSKSIESIEQEAISCDFVSMDVTNSLDQDIFGMEINGVAVGDIKSGETITEVCLDNMMIDQGINYPLIHILGTYDGKFLGENFGYCGVGTASITTGIFSIEITDTSEYLFFYSNQ